MFNYVCTEIIKYEDDYQVYKLKRIKDENIVLVECNTENYLHKLDNGGIHECSRNPLLGLKKYPKIVVKAIYISGFENFPSYCNCCIYSPFSDEKQSSKLLKEIKGMDDDIIKQYIRTNLFEYVTPYMANIIQSYNINEDVTEEQIKDGYISLMYDYIKSKQ